MFLQIVRKTKFVELANIVAWLCKDRSSAEFQMDQVPWDY